MHVLKGIEKKVLPGDLSEAVRLVICYNDCSDRANYMAWQGHYAVMTWYHKEMERCDRELRVLFARKKEDEQVKSMIKHLKDLGITELKITLEGLEV